jgi:hypothetical protein
LRIAIVDTYYPAFLAATYRQLPRLDGTPYEGQLQALIDTCFGTSDFYSRHLRALGCEAIDLVANCLPLQAAWARENRLPVSRLAMRVPGRAYRLPLLGRWLAGLPGLLDIAMAQVRAFRPDVLYCQDLSFFPPEHLAALKPHARLVVGQIASPLPPPAFLAGYDLILTSFPHFVPRLRAMGLGSEYFRIGFDTRVLERAGTVEKNIGVSFVGGISRHHDKAVPLLERLARQTPIEFFGYGAASLDAGSPIAARHRGEVWGLEMYRTLARSRVTLNRHINVAENYANNMRLYEATGMGAMLLTDRKDNLGELFDVGREVAAYGSPVEAVEMINHYAAHPDEAAAIARAGQQRTLREHTYAHRMNELLPLLRAWLGRKATTG